MHSSHLWLYDATNQCVLNINTPSIPTLESLAGDKCHDNLYQNEEGHSYILYRVRKVRGEGFLEQDFLGQDFPLPAMIGSNLKTVYPLTAGKYG